MSHYHSTESPIVLYSAQDASLAAHRMRRARNLKHQAKEDFDTVKRRALGLTPRPQRAGLITRLVSALRIQ